MGGPNPSAIVLHIPSNPRALDFDGVLCDSVGESSLSAWKAAEKLWPEIFTKYDFHNTVFYFANHRSDGSFL